MSVDRVTSNFAQRPPRHLTNGRASRRHQIAIDDSTGQAVAYIRWILPQHLASAHPVVWPEAQVQEPTQQDKARFDKQYEDASEQGLRPDLLAYRSAPLEKIDAKIRESGPFLGMHTCTRDCQCRSTPDRKVQLTSWLRPELDYLTTAPEYQRRGIGAMLLVTGLEVADAHGLKAYVTSSVVGAKLYQKHGFEVVETCSTDYSQFGGVEHEVNIFMIRKPRVRA